MEKTRQHARDVFTLKAYSDAEAADLAAFLLDRSQYFAVIPLPDDEWAIEVTEFPFGLLDTAATAESKAIAGQLDAGVDAADVELSDRRSGFTPEQRATIRAGGFPKCDDCGKPTATGLKHRGLVGGCWLCGACFDKAYEANQRTARAARTEPVCAECGQPATGRSALCPDRWLCTTCGTAAQGGVK